MLQTCPTRNSTEAVSRPPTSDDSSRRRTSSATEVASNAAAVPTPPLIPIARPAVIPVPADTASTSTKSLKLDDPCANNAAGSSSYEANPMTHANQQHLPTRKGRRSQSSSSAAARPSPLGRVSRPDAPPAADVTAPGQTPIHPAIAALVSMGQLLGVMYPSSAESAHPAVPVASNSPMVVAASPMDDTVAGTAAAQAVLQPDVLAVLSSLTPTMGEFEAAIACLMACAGGMAPSGMPGPVAGVPGQVAAHIWG